MSYLLNYSNWKKLHEAANGELPNADLEPIPVLPTESGERHSLNPVAADAYAKMVAAAKADGIEWGITDSYRPLKVQKRLVKEKGLYSQGGLAAAPGTSNHGWGSAVDLDFKKGSGNAAHKWLKNNAEKFGFSTIPREPWHWEHKESAKTVKSGESTATILTQADTVSDTKSKLFNDKVDDLMTTPSVATILKYKDGINYMTAADKEEIRKQLGGVSMSQIDDWVAGKISDRDFISLAVTTMLSQKNNNPSLQPVEAGTKLLKSGSSGDDVKAIQTKLKELGYFTKEPNGEFDKDTYAAVKAFQTSASIGVDGIVGPQTYGALFGVQVDPKAVELAKVERGKIELANGKIKSSYTGEKQNNINLLINEMTRQGITNPYSQVGMLAVIGKESNFIPKNEVMDYSKERLPEVWGVFSKTGQMVPKGQGATQYNDLAVQYEHKPEELANFVYGQKPNGMRGNAYGNTQPGDGWKYRGRGFNGITFKSGYEKYADATGLDLVNNPDQLNDPATAAKVAVLYFINTIKPYNIDLNSFTSAEDATKVFARANAGWKSAQSVQDWAYANAAKIIPNFVIEPGAVV